MKYSHLTTILVSLALTGCALTPAQKAQREAEKIKAQQLLSIELAKQCDAETASLMEKKLNPPVSQTAEEKEKLDKAYATKSKIRFSKPATKWRGKAIKHRQK